ncbi:hypothetical protein EUX98_g4864 [Antrodiella citrinella]|uniref:Myosin motor domain-containing protein n=1 Tax=Antrodiella citrinella TaxID=2447956 RepID=A0A4V3XII0_9APHY|nr:hypothetical protein EUX98_g4864 [Antrodiella citrinella]
MPSTGLPRNSSFRRNAHSKHQSISISGSASSLNSKGRLGLLERQILQANPILEAFGNAQTQRNNNSSRFGKFIRISFAPDGSIAGANIDWYLLEKSRVVVRSEAERSFHVFYQLMEAGGSLKDTLLLSGGVEDYEYLNKSRREVDGIDDTEEWSALMSALDIVGFSPAEQLDLFRVVAAVLHIGNIIITATRADDAVMPDPSQAERVCHLLGIPVNDFIRAVLRPRVLAGREWVNQARTRQQALDELGALCKTLYEKSFGMLVDRINRALDRPSSKSTFIGVLDIAGFEIFEVNGYEQLLINYTNERLQQFFNHHMFVLEQEEYAREGIEWDYVNFGLDLQPTIDLIETSGNAIGILSLLDEECIMPKATDLTFTNKLHALWATDAPPGEEDHPGKTKYEAARFDQGFIVHHYAGRVEYRTDSWLEKNKDPLNDNLTRVLASSSEKYVATLFAEYGDAPSQVSSHVNTFATMGKKRQAKKGAFRTVGQRHKEQLASLMSQLQATQPHFVRCIVPNTMKKPGRVDVPLVLDQLRCNGVLEGIRIARLGYPNRLPFVEFRQRYEVLTPGIIPRGYMDGRKACLRMVDALELDKAIFKIGTSKIFFKAGVLADLEERRDALLFDIFSKLQAAARMFTARRQMKKILNRAVAIRTVQRNARVYGELRDWPWWQLYTKVRPLLAATRSDEELRRKELELVLVKERAERDKSEREALENLKMRLESEKGKVEEQLEAERALALDKESLLERSKKRELELEEDVAALQLDLDTLDSQLDRALKLQKESEEKHETLRQAFDQAAEHLVRLESEQVIWTQKEAELNAQLEDAHEDLDIFAAEKEELQKVAEELKNLVVQREEDVARAKERMEHAVHELDAKLANEQRSKDALQSKAETLEQDARHAKEQLAELGRAATDYSNIIQQREEDIDKLSAELTNSKRERARLMKEITELQGQVDTLKSEIQAEHDEQRRDASVRSKLQEELDELRTLLAAKANEETRRSEAEKSKEDELLLLRSQVSQLSQDLSDARKTAVEGQSKLKVELDTMTREYQSLQQSHRSLSDRSQSAQAQLKKAEAALYETEKAKRTIDSELQSIRTRQIDVDGRLAETVKEKEALSRKLTAAQTKYQDFEDVVLQLEREKAAHDRQLDTLRHQLDSETKKRTQVEHAVSTQKTEIVRLKDLNVKLNRELNKAFDDLKAREWEVKQLEAKQDKTIVEHVHVLEEAKRVTDGLLAAAQATLREQSAYIRSLENNKKRLIGEAEDANRERERAQLELRNKVKLQARLQELETNSSASSTIHLELQEVVESYKTKTDSYLKKAEEAEVAKTKAQRAEQSVRRALSDAEKAHSSTVAEKNVLADKLKVAEARIRDLQHRLEAEGRESSDLDVLRQRLTEEMEDERKQHQQDLAERDFTADQTRKKYQTELAQLSEELQSQRDTMSRLREETRNIRSDYDELQLRYDDEVYNGGAWKKEKERLETKIQDLNKAYESSAAAQTEQQSQIVSLHSQVRELRSVLNDAEADRALLQKARRALQAELESIKLDSVDTTKLSSDTELQNLRLKKQDLERSLEEQQDRVAMSTERMKKAEGYAAECQLELGKIRVENSELEKANANLEKQVKELNVRIVDLETKSLNSPKPTTSRRLENRIEELTSQLTLTTKDSSRLRSVDKTARDTKSQLAEADRQRTRLEEEVKSYEVKVLNMRHKMDELQTSENNLQLAKRRAEREAADFKQKSLNLEREIERLRNRLDRPSNVLHESPVTSPRK